VHQQQQAGAQSDGNIIFSFSFLVPADRSARPDQQEKKRHLLQ
jgi:hypothetical protein